MGKDNRTTLPTRKSYRTRSNVTKVIITPGGRHVAHLVGKKAVAPKCGDCKKPLAGLSAVRSSDKVSYYKRTVARAYGGAVCANCVKERITRAFLIEEQKIVKRVIKEQAKKVAAAQSEVNKKAKSVAKAQGKKK